MIGKNQIDFFKKIGFDKKINVENMEVANPLNKNNGVNLRLLLLDLVMVFQ